MRVVNNTLKRRVNAVPYGDTVRREGDDALYIVVDFFVGDGSVRLVDLETGKVLKIPNAEEVVIVENTYIEFED